MRKSKQNYESSFPALSEKEIIILADENDYISDYGIPIIKNSKKKNRDSSFSSSTQITNFYEIEGKFQKDFLNQSNHFNKLTILEPYYNLPPGNFFFPLNSNFNFKVSFANY